MKLTVLVENRPTISFRQELQCSFCGMAHPTDEPKLLRALEDSKMLSHPAFHYQICPICGNSGSFEDRKEEWDNIAFNRKSALEELSKLSGGKPLSPSEERGWKIIDDELYKRFTNNKIRPGRCRQKNIDGFYCGMTTIGAPSNSTCLKCLEKK